jgi:hypothetical protein
MCFQADLSSQGGMDAVGSNDKIRLDGRTSTSNVISLQPKRTAHFGLWRWTHGGLRSQQPENFLTADASRSPHGDVTIPAQLIRPFTTLARTMQEGLAFRLKGSIGVMAERA